MIDSSISPQASVAERHYMAPSAFFVRSADHATFLDVPPPKKRAAGFNSGDRECHAVL